MVEDLKGVLCQGRRCSSAPESSETIARPPAESFYKHLGRTAGAEENQHRESAWFEKRSESFRHRVNILHAVERCEIRECSIEKRFTNPLAFLCKVRYFFSGDDLGTRAQRGELLSGDINHRWRSIREKYAKAPFGKEQRIFTGSSSNLQNVTLRRKLPNEDSSHGTPLRRNTCACTESLVEVRSDRIEGQSSGTKGSCRHGRLLLSVFHRRDSMRRRSPSIT